MVARLFEEKRVDVLVAAVPRVLARYPDVEFQIVGEGPCRARLMDQARDGGVLPHVQFMGHRDDVPAILASSDVFVLSSESEASPNVIIEAMAAGLPVVASNVGGIPELVTEAVTGHLVPPADPNALASAILDLLDHPDRAIAFGEAARARIEQQYSFDRMVAQFESLYTSRSIDPARSNVRNSSGRNQCPA